MARKRIYKPRPVASSNPQRVCDKTKKQEDKKRSIFKKILNIPFRQEREELLMQLV